MRLRVVHFGSRWFALPEKTRGSLVGSSRDGVDFGDVSGKLGRPGTESARGLNSEF